MLPHQPWFPSKLIAVAALCAVLTGVRAQPEAADEAADHWPADTGVRPELLQELPFPESSDSTVPAPPEPEQGAGAASAQGIGNHDVSEMAAAQFSDSTILAVIAANSVSFDISPRALVALKAAGVSERVIEAMLAAESAKREPEPEPEETPEALAATQAAQEYAKLTEMIEQLAAQQEKAAAARREPEPSARTDSTPRVWLLSPAERTPVAPTIAQVAFAGGAKRGNDRLKTLQGLGNQALAFANPAVSGIATTLSSIFKPDEERTAVWALAATSSSRVLNYSPSFEIDFAHIPGVDPDKYQPAIVQLVPTNDNYRLVAAAETDGSNTRALPNGPIIEENVAADLTRIGRGQYKVESKPALGPGEYALVIRPIPQSARARRRNSETSLGELMGGSTSQILYLTWEFSVAAN